MSSHVFRFLGKPAEGSTQRWRLDDEDARHALKVLRLPAGETVEATDGQGNVVTGTLIPTGKESADVEVSSLTRTDRPYPLLHLALGALKPGDLDDVLPGLVELGMQRISIFLTEQSGKSRLAEKSIERWQRIIHGAVKQSKQAWMPDLATYESLTDFLDRGLDGSELDASGKCTGWILAAPGDETAAAGRKDQDPVTALEAIAGLNQPGHLMVLVGSEKGFSADEIEGALAAGFKPVTLPGSVLRARTAAVSAATMLAMAAHRSR